MVNEIIQGDVCAVLRTLPAASVQSIANGVKFFAGLIQLLTSCDVLRAMPPALNLDWLAPSAFHCDGMGNFVGVIPQAVGERTAGAAGEGIGVSNDRQRNKTTNRRSSQ